MANNSAREERIWDLIEETRNDIKKTREQAQIEMQEFRAGIKELRALQKETD